MENTNNLFTNLLFLGILLALIFYSYKQNKKQNAIAFSVVAVLYVLYIFKAWII